MSGYLSNLVARAQGKPAGLRPKPAAFFEKPQLEVPLESRAEIRETSSVEPRNPVVRTSASSPASSRDASLRGCPEVEESGGNVGGHTKVSAPDSAQVNASDSSAQPPKKKYAPETIPRNADPRAAESEELSPKLNTNITSGKIDSAAPQEIDPAENINERNGNSRQLTPDCRPAFKPEHGNSPAPDHSRQPRASNIESSPPPVHVTIGRVEVRAIMPESRPLRQPRPAAPKFSLGDFLNRPRGGAR